MAYFINIPKGPTDAEIEDTVAEVAKQIMSMGKQEVMEVFGFTQDEVNFLFDGTEQEKEVWE